MSTAASLPSFDAFRGAAVVMGVTSCGKTTAGEALARATGAVFIEGDRMHPTENIAKMSAGIALDDDDRWPWLARVGNALSAAATGNRGAIASCSALKRSYRTKLAEAAGRPVLFVFLSGPKSLLAARIAARKDHFMPASLLDSQLAALEAPLGDENAIEIDIAQPLAAIVAQAAEFLSRQGADR